MPTSRNHRHKRMKAQASAVIRRFVGRKGERKLIPPVGVTVDDTRGARRDIWLTPTKGWRNMHMVR